MMMSCNIYIASFSTFPISLFFSLSPFFFIFPAHRPSHTIGKNLKLSQFALFAFKYVLPDPLWAFEASCFYWKLLQVWRSATPSHQLPSSHPPDPPLRHSTLASLIVVAFIGFID